MASESYMATMNSPLRPKTEIRILITNADADSPPAPESAISIEFKGKDIISSVEYYQIDPVSRNLPEHTLEFSVLDTNRNLQERYDWESLRCRAYVFYEQMYILGLPYTSYKEPPERHTFYIKNATNEGQITTFHCQDVIWVLNNHLLPREKIQDATVPSRKRIVDDIIKYPPPGTKLLISPFAYESDLTLQPYYDDTVAVLLQKLLNPWGFMQIVSGHGKYYESPSNTWTIKDYSATFKTSPDSNAYVLNIKNVYKDGIQRITMPPVSEVTCNTRDVELSENTYYMVDVTGERTGDYFPDPNSHQPNSYQIVRFNRPLLDVKVHSETDKVRRIEQKSLYECTIYWNQNLDFVSPKPTIVLDGKPVYQWVKSKKQSIPHVPHGSTESLENPYINGAIFWKLPYTPYTYRNVLKIKYRGDVTLFPGVDIIWFEYSDNKRIPCQVISNKTIIKSSMSGELTLKILLTDAEIKKLTPAVVSQSTNFMSHESDNSEQFIEEVTK